MTWRTKDNKPPMEKLAVDLQKRTPGRSEETSVWRERQKEKRKEFKDVVKLEGIVQNEDMAMILRRRPDPMDDESSEDKHLMSGRVCLCVISVVTVGKVFCDTCRSRQVVISSRLVITVLQSKHGSQSGHARPRSVDLRSSKSSPNHLR